MMKVRELVEKLNTVDQELEVVIEVDWRSNEAEEVFVTVADNYSILMITDGGRTAPTDAKVL